jgi:hypothetical protein
MQVLGKTLVRLTGESAVSRSNETNFGDLICDTMVKAAAATKAGKEAGNDLLCMFNSGSIRQVDTWGWVGLGSGRVGWKGRQGRLVGEGKGAQCACLCWAAHVAAGWAHCPGGRGSWTCMCAVARPALAPA